MINELLWLLLPIAAATGWWAGWQMQRKSRNKTAVGYTRDYFKGLNYLLNEQQDKALEVFIRMVQVDSDTVETHLALGNLFRRRGEVDRAIRIHQNLIARPTLNPVQRDEAVAELAHDYMRAGLLDRAEGLFRELLSSHHHLETALYNLLDIYEREKEWSKAIDIAQRLHKLGNDKNIHEVIAHYYCELGEEALRNEDEKTAKTQIRKALEMDPDCSRGHMLNAAIARAHGKNQQAIKAYRHIQEHDPELLPEVIEPLLDCLLANNDSDALWHYLTSIRQQHNAYSVMHTVTDLLRRLEGEAAAQEFFKEQLLKRPSLRGLRDWVEHEFERAEGHTRNAISVILDMLTKVIASKPTYCCTRCGFTGQNLHWQCPGCRSWNSVKPIIGVEGE